MGILKVWDGGQWVEVNVTGSGGVGVHGFADVVNHTASTLAEVNSLISDATLIDTADSRLSDDRDPSLHGLGDISRHSASTLAELNTLISDATLDSTSSSRAPNGFATGDLTASYPNPVVAAITTLSGSGTRLEIGDIPDGYNLVRNGSIIIGISGAAPGAHATGHISGGSDEIDGDRLNIDYVSTNYTRTTAPSEVTNVEQLTAHLAGIDNALAAGIVPHGFADVVNHTASTLAEVNTLITDATLDTSTAQRPAAPHGFADVVRHTSSALAEVNALISDATLIDTGDSRLSDDRDPNLHGLANASRHSASSLAELNALISDATLDTNTAERPAAAHGFADVVRHTASTLAEVNTLISDATLIDTGDSRLSDDRDPNLHGLGNSARHSASTLAELNALISDATLDDISGNRTDADAIHDNVAGEISAITAKGTPVANDYLLIEDSADSNNKKHIRLGSLTGSAGLVAHGFADVVYHTASTLAEVNTLITDATLDSTSSSRPPNGFATGDLTASYPNPAVAAITTLSGSGTRLEIGNIPDGYNLVRSGTTIIGTSGSAPGAHAASHISGGSDQIDGDRLNIDYVSTNYTRTTAPSEVTNVEQLTAHLAGIDNALGAGIVPHGFADVVNHTASTLAEVNSLISDATLDTNTAERPAAAHGFADVVRHTASTLAEVNTLISDATLIDTGDSRLSDDRDPNLHGLGNSARHSASTLAELNALVSDATLDTNTAERPAAAHGFADVVRHTASTLAEVNTLISDATLIDTADSRLSDDRDPNLHGLGNSARHSASTLAELNALVSDATLDTNTASRPAQTHGFADVVRHSASTLAEVNTLISDATLDTNTAERPAAAHGFADVVRHTASTLAEVNTLISDATLIDTADSRLSDDRDPNLHGLGNSARHSASTLAELNALISDATLDTNTASRPAAAHGFADVVRHTASTLAEVNTLISDATLYEWENDLGGTQIHTNNVPDGADATAIHDNTSGEIAAITQKTVPVANDILLIEDSAATNAKKRVLWGTITGSGGLSAHGFADVVYHTASTLAEVNSLITDATLDSTSSSRPPNGFATGDLTGSYPNPAVAAITTLSGSGTRLEIADITAGETLVRVGNTITSQAAGAPGAHAATHIHSGSDEINGDLLDIDYVPVHYTRDTSGPLVTSVEELTAHLAGIDNQLSGTTRKDYGTRATDPTTPTPAEGDKYYNTDLEMDMRYDGSRSKWLSIESSTFSFGKSGNGAAGAYFDGPDGIAFSSTDGFPAFHSGTVVSIGYTRTDTDAAVFQVTADGTEVAFISSSATVGTNTAADGDFSPNQVLGVLNKTGGNTVSNIVGWVKVKWRI